MHQIDPSSARLMDSVGIDSSGFRSRRLTREMAESADLILCFEAAQRKEIVTIAPMAVRYTFMLDDFANMCRYSAEHGLVKGLTIQERLQSVIDSSSFIRPLIAAPKDIADPHGREFAKFRQAAEETNRALRTILSSMRKHYRVDPAPVHPQITRPDFNSIIYASCQSQARQARYASSLCSRLNTPFIGVSCHNGLETSTGVWLEQR